MKKQKQSINYSLTYPKIVALGFALIIAVGTALLMLPISTNQGQSTSFMDAFFTAASATCVTGLTVYDTYTHWSTFGQVVILCLIQIGGLGFVTVTGFVFQFVKHRTSIKEKMLLKESLGALQIVDVKSLIRTVLLITAIFEAVGAILLAIRFIPATNSIGKGLFMAVFTSISAYCNAGFDLMGYFEPSSSLVAFNDDYLVILTISALIIAGGIGFIVWNDLVKRKLKFEKLTIHTKIVLITTGILLVGGTIAYFAFEYNNAFENMNFGKSLLNAFFCSTTRSAGFSSIGLEDLSNPSKMLTMLLMFVGGSSGSTAGGIKTTTVALLFLCVLSTMRNKEDINVFNKRIPSTYVKKAITIVFFNLSVIIVSTFLISLIQPEFKLINLLFECTSATSTAGMAAGVVANFATVPKLIIIGMMYIGRLTSFIFVMMFVTPKAKTTTQKPKDTLIIG